MTLPFRLTDSTLRDGSHAIAHQYTVAQVQQLVYQLDRAGVPVIEVSHGDGLGGSSFNYGFAQTNELELVRVAAQAATSAQIAVLLLPGIGVQDELVQAHEGGASIVRVATHCTEADVSEQHIRAAKELGMEAAGFLMMSHMSDPASLLEQGRKMQSYGSDCVYIVDSAGAMTMDSVRRAVGLLREELDCEVGMHAHNNLGLAVANSVCAVEEGATQIDACCTGLGAGAGNCPTEILVAVCDKMGLATGVDPIAIMELAEEYVRPLVPTQGVIDRNRLILGYAGVYGSFLLHIERAASRYGVPVEQIVLALGRRGIVGGQEDMIIDVAMELRGAAAPAK